MPQRRDINQVRIFRVHSYTSYLAGILQANVLPGLAGVHRFVNAVPVGYIAPDVVFACAHVNDVRIRLRYRNRSNRGSSEILSVGDGLPVRAGVFRFPDATANTTEIERVGSGFDTCHRRNASASKGTYRP